MVTAHMTICSRLAATIFFVLQAGAAFAQSAPTVTVTRLADRFYRLTATVPYPTSLLAYVSPAGILLVDSGSIETGDELKRVLKTLDGGRADVKMLVNTHAHIDHTGGNRDADVARRPCRGRGRDVPRHAASLARLIVAFKNDLS